MASMRTTIRPNSRLRSSMNSPDILVTNPPMLWPFRYRVMPFFSLWLLSNSSFMASLSFPASAGAPTRAPANAVIHILRDISMVFITTFTFYMRNVGVIPITPSSIALLVPAKLMSVPVRNGAGRLPLQHQCIPQEHGRRAHAEPSRHTTALTMHLPAGEVEILHLMESRARSQYHRPRPASPA